MRWWILIGCGVLVIAAAIWPFGRKTEQLGTVPMPPLVASRPTPAPKPEPAKIVEVIDLARAYEPVREPEEPAGAVNPASFIQVPEGPKRIPPAVDWDGEPYSDELRAIDAFMGCLFGSRYPASSRIDVMPRQVGSISNRLRFTPMGEPYAVGPVEALKVMPRELHGGLLNFVPTTPASGEFNFIPMSVPYEIGITQPIPPNAWIIQGPVEPLKVMPREVK